jgi:hypothetical protein
VAGYQVLAAEATGNKLPAIAANPGKPDRAIAEKIGVGQPTVSKVKKGN